MSCCATWPASWAGSGFELSIESEIEAFVERTRVLPFLHAATRMPLDVVMAGPGLEQEFLARAQRVELDGVDVPVLSPAGVRGAVGAGTPSGALAPVRRLAEARVRSMK